MTYLFTFLITISSIVLANDGGAHNPSSKAWDMYQAGEKFHKDVSIIRKRHPNFLRHKRNQTLIHGIRNDENSLKGCVSCHANKDKNGYVPANKRDQFCSSCHQKVGISIDCFSCHRTTPTGEAL